MGRTLVCSIFLPYTINFHLDELEDKGHENHPASSSYEISRNRRNSIRIDNALSHLAISQKESSQATPAPLTPAFSPQHENTSDYFNLSSFKRGGGTKTPKTPKTPNIGTASPLPSSGRSSPVYTQPRSRAGSPPPFAKRDDRFGAPGLGTKQKLLQKRRDSLKKDVALFDSARWTVERGIIGNSGLFHAVDAAVRDKKLVNNVWVGLLGMPTETLSKKTKDAISAALLVKHQSLAVYTSDSDFEGHYNHYCRKILWPSLHYQHNEIFSFFHEESNWDAYVRVNQAFADKVVESYHPGDTVWVNDYHLLLVPEMVRKKMPNVAIGLFIHVSFPSSEVFRCFARRNELLRGMLGANLIGFQTEEYKRHFLQSCSRVIYAEATFDRILLEDRYIDVYSHPVSADPEAVQAYLDNEETIDTINLLKKRYENLNIFVGCDKMDPIRGIREKLLAFEQFLYDNPSYQKNTILLQTATMTEDARKYGVEVSEIVTRINSTFGDFSIDHLPVTFLSSDLTYPQYLALLSIADAFIVSSLREGMSLTCHEFILSQKEKKSLLIVSEFIGCAAFFRKGAFIVNPWSFLEMSQAMREALELDDSSKIKRYELCLNVINSHTASTWAAEFENKLRKSWSSQQKHDLSHIPRFTLNFVGSRYANAKKRLLFLNFDGQAVSWEGRHEFVDFHYGYMINILTRMVNDPKNIVYICSCLDRDELETFFVNIPGMGLIAENGCYVKPHTASEDNLQTWIRLFKKEQMAWRESMHDIIEYYSERTPGSALIDHGYAMEFNYVKVENRDSGLRNAVELCSSVNETGHACKAIPMEGHVLVEPKDISKSTAADYTLKKILHEPSDLDLVLVAGNNRTDEGTFIWANRLPVFSFTVSMRVENTEARSYTDGIPSFLNVLNSLCD
ncbi:alpha,alpha-trehalose-phosphate synthase [Schizosaccharomyces cryophilus OY26]|uniref:Alpha,alpha-trehalose-phosphate synthase n=1 Tax=Schizosaccharomyces cryophilus (strain OY26 / ATCC MYA-4695 / CBS 11777 / NBRC 106824 / NRRL Y48691) TaxID=653667 RepID=S9VWM7_SCHCR|nr:alpha,alpha-trehalose-phosphate synthase [Schizosaccharomyces cryophilus OY26]EPY50335.1 alpha,alpha-trehalose-phosphate synthase [Schizosaccharomyces cryophilus OY26]